ncbi:hypothetical protein BY996DRAFT_1038594 [Phakopsora pachyrhizi]|nr:hypothetical protein BY996DRAFT_1038594 [Phakopsora pachyrhizi]
MTEAGMLIQQVALALFEIQELRHSNSLNQSPAKDTTGLKHSGASSTPRPQATTDQALIKLERKALETSQELIRISQALQNLCSDPTAPGPDFLIEKLENLRSEWLKVERDVETLKEELKEDKWLVVFRTVSSQAEEMMKSLEKACRLVDEFILEVEISECDDDDGGGLKRSTNRQHSLPDQAIKTRRNRTSLGPGVVVTESRRKKISDSLDLDQLTKSFATLQKNFDAKKKHYLPSCERVLGILAKGIESRSTKNGQVLRRYFDMKTRFSSLQDRIATLEHALEEFQNFLPLQTNVDPLATSGLPPNPTTASPLTQPSPISAPLTLASRTKKTLSSMTQYLRPASPTSLAKNSAESTLSPFKRLAARISSSTASRPVPRSQTPSVCSTQSVPSLQSGSQALVQAGYKSSQLSQSLSIGLTPPANHLRSVRSTLKLGPSASTSSSSFSSRPPPAPSARVSSALQARSQPSVLKTPTTANSYQSSITNSRMLSRSRLGINKLASSSAPTNPKPRWNISLKPVEDSPTFLNAPVSRIQQTNFRNASHSYSPTARLSSTDSRLNLRSQTPNLTRASMAKHHQLTQQRVPSYDRPGSAAGRSDASVLTMVSIAGYRSRPISRDCRIPGPVWDPTILSRGSLSRSQSRIGNERDSRSSVGPGRVALSPTPSDFDVLRGILRSSSRAESRAGEHCLIPVARYSRKISKQVTEGESGLEVEELKDFERGALEEGVEEITGEVDESKRRQEDPLEAAIALTLNRQSLQSYLKSNTQRFTFKRVELSKSHKLSEVGEMKNEDDGIRYFFGITGIRSNKKLRGVDETKRQIKRLNEDCEISWMKRSVYCKVERKDGEVYVKESEERNWKCLESYLKEDFLT